MGRLGDDDQIVAMKVIKLPDNVELSRLKELEVGTVPSILASH